MPTTATFVTSQGSFEVSLMPDHAPTTVANFVDLATGKREWRDPGDGQRKTEPLYNGTVFHRVIPNFMIRSASVWDRMGFRAIDSGRGPASGPKSTSPNLLPIATPCPNTNGSSSS